MSANWFLGVNVFDLDFGVQVDSVEQPIKSNSVRSGNMSHCRASSLHNNLDHCFVVFKHIQQKFLLWRSDVALRDCLRLWIMWCEEQISLELTTGRPVLSWFWVVFPRTETIRSHKSRAGIPSNLNPTSKEMISDSIELCETEVWFLHIQLFGTNVWLPKTHNVPPEVDFESSRSPAKSESWNSRNLHCFAVLPT